MNKLSHPKIGTAKSRSTRSQVINADASSNANLQAYKKSALEKALAAVSRLEDEVSSLEQK